MKNPCMYCVPPERHPGCYCEDKREWDEQRKAGLQARIDDIAFDQYQSDRCKAAKKRLCSSLA